MTTIKIEIDTVGAPHDVVAKSEPSNQRLATAKPIVLISTISLTRELKQNFKSGAGQTPLWKDGVDYDDLPTTVKTYDNANGLVVTTGGLIAFSAARDNLMTAYFVSLLATVPTGNIGRCVGGVTVSGYTANADRVDFLVGAGRARASIGLVCNIKSAMNQNEEADWNNIAGVNHTIIHAGNAAGKNNGGHYREAFDAVDAANITTVVLSADPFFFHSREKLIAQANAWVARGAANLRYVCYPFEDFANTGGTNQPTAGTASWYGGSLLDAYEQIGVTAALQLNNTSSVGFTAISDTSGNF
jgi:hypothetical protein